MTLVDLLPWLLLAGFVFFAVQKGRRQWAMLIALHGVSAVLLGVGLMLLGNEDISRPGMFLNHFHLALAWPLMAPFVLWGIGLAAVGLIASMALLLLALAAECAIYLAAYRLSQAMSRRLDAWLDQRKGGESS